MSQRFEDPEERLSDEEVQAIVQRYGERQAGADPRPTVGDVAEALQVEPAVVSRLLRDIRTADSERQLKERLDALERENEELRRRAEDSDFGYDGFYSSMHWHHGRHMRRRGRRFFVIAMAMSAAMLAAGVATAAGGSSAGVWRVFAVVVVGLVALRMLRRYNGER